jgi:hypothetical protein
MVQQKTSGLMVRLQAVGWNDRSKWLQELIRSAESPELQSLEAEMEAVLEAGRYR